MDKVFVGLTLASTFMKWSVVEKGKGRPFPYEGTYFQKVMWSNKEKAYPATRAQVPIPYEGVYLVEVLVGLTPCAASPCGMCQPLRYRSYISKEKAYPATRAQVPFPYEFVNFGKAHTCISFLTGTIGAMFFAEYFFSNPCCMNGENCEPNRK